MKIVLSLVIAGVVELLGPGSRQVARNQQTERADGTGQFWEIAVFPAPGVNGFSRLQVWQSKREAGKYTRVRIQERELQIPEAQRIARELYDFSIPLYANPNSALAENRMAVLCGTTENTLRLVSVQSLAVGRSIALPAAARALALRPGQSEVWVAHGGASNQISIVDMVGERVAASIPLRLNPQVVPVGVFFSASGRNAYVVVRHAESTTDRGFVIVIDPAARTIRAQVSLGTTTPQAAVLSPDGNALYIGGASINEAGVSEPSLSTFETVTNTVSLTAGGLPAVPEQLALHPNGLRIFIPFPTTFALDEYDVQARRVVRRVQLPRLLVPQNLEFSPNGDVLIVRDTAGQQALHLDPESGEVLDSQVIPAGPGVAVVRP